MGVEIVLQIPSIERGHLGHAFAITFTYFENEIPQGANRKIEEFASMIS
jgi:hypothetical protein